MSETNFRAICWWHYWKGQVITKVIRIHCLENKNVQIYWADEEIFHWISIKFDFFKELYTKSADHLSHKDSSSADHEHLYKSVTSSRETKPQPKGE